ncbi:hypothetical protein R3P38DRAFT_3194548 [Favolaschia claudopus]|uniref:C3H1-type domain-containing protein n=1 Tax=Favolaschia claudopus TaxID=2862362 RepID=A0AAW0BDH8_9AGAR
MSQARNARTPTEDLQYHLQAVVDDFRHGQLTREQAEYQLVGTLQHGCDVYHWDYDAQYLIPYLQQLDQHEYIMAQAQNPRAGAQGQQPPNPGPAAANAGTLGGDFAPGSVNEPHHNGGERGRTDGHNGGRRRRRHHSSSSDSSSESASRERRGKKPRLDKTRMGFDPSDNGPQLDPYRRDVADLLENYSRDPKEVLRLTQTRAGCPQFTEAGWKSLLAGEYVDFDAVAQEIFGYRVDNSDRWHQIWHLYAKCVAFAFHMRRAELETYNEFVKNLFISTDITHNVIACDKAIRTFLGTSKHHLFNDVQLFQRFQHSHLIPGGIHYRPKGSSTSGSAGSTRKRVGGKSDDSSVEICRNWNVGKCSFGDKCKRLHICNERGCHKNHPKTQHSRD